MTKIEEGNTVIVNYPDYEPREATVTGETENRGYRVEYEGGKPDTVLPRFIVNVVCHDPDHPALYHDSKEKWFCPFCP